MDPLRIGEKKKFRDILGGSWNTSDSGDSWKVSTSAPSVINDIEVLEVCMFDEENKKIVKDLENPEKQKDRFHYVVKFKNNLSGDIKHYIILTDGFTWHPVNESIELLLWLNKIDQLKVIKAIQEAHKAS